MIEAYTRFLLRLKPSEPFYQEYVTVAVTITLVVVITVVSLTVYLLSNSPLPACRVAW